MKTELQSVSAWWVWALSLIVVVSIMQSAALSVAVFFAVSGLGFLKTRNGINQKIFAWISLSAFSIAISRIILQILFGNQISGNVIFEIPSFSLPDFLSGIRIGGPVTSASLEIGILYGFRLATIVVVLGLSSSVAPLQILFQKAPPALRQVSLVFSLAGNFVPQIMNDITRLQRAARWRGENTSALKRFINNFIPLTETVLERSINLGAALTIRGYSNNTRVSNWQWLQRAALLIFAFTATLWIFGLADKNLLRLFLAVGIVLSIVSLKISMAESDARKDNKGLEIKQLLLMLHPMLIGPFVITLLSLWTASLSNSAIELNQFAWVWQLLSCAFLIAFIFRLPNLRQDKSLASL